MYLKMLEQVSDFEWDKGNKNKNFSKHQVADEECEEVFFDQNKKILKDTQHSAKEERYIMIGQTKKQRPLFIIFTLRKDKLRIISARDLKRKEYELY